VAGCRMEGKGDESATQKRRPCMKGSSGCCLAWRGRAFHLHPGHASPAAVWMCVNG